MARNSARPSLDLRWISADGADMGRADRDPESIAVFVAQPCLLPEHWHRTVDRVLSETEKQRGDRFRNPADRITWRAAHAVKRLSLTACEPAVEPDAWTFTVNTHGKPEIAGPKSSLRFNLSHTRDFVGCAVTKFGSVGFDVEDTAYAVDPMVAEKKFSRDDVLFIGHPGNEDWQERFYTIWTLKESYLKARGTGLSVPLKRISLERDGIGEWHVRRPAGRSEGEKECHLFSLAIRQRYRAAVSVLR